MKMNDKGVLIIVSHLIITLAIILGYIYSIHSGHPDDTFKNALFVIVGYWFGAIGLNKVKSIDGQAASSKGDTPNE